MWVKFAERHRQPGDPIFRIANLNRLTIKAEIGTHFYLPQDVQGRPVSIEMMVRSKEGLIYRPVVPRQGRHPIVTFARPEVTRDHTFEIRVDVENVKDAEGRWLLLPGQPVRLTLHLDRPPRQILSPPR